jgi:16S rRNA (guanine527-N7)-methyltransferase
VTAPRDTLVPPPPARAHEVFGSRVDLAARYAAQLCTVAVERGLFGPREPERVWERHVIPGGALGSLVRPGERVIDVGSGAGLPGIPLAIARPDVAVTLLEPMERRIVFLQETAAELGLSIDIVRGRGEAAEHVRGDVVVARAVAPLSRLLSLTLPLLEAGGRVLAVKGASAADEIAAAADDLAAAGSIADITQVGQDADLTTVVVVQTGEVRAHSQPRRPPARRQGTRGAS